MRRFIIFNLLFVLLAFGTVSVWGQSGYSDTVYLPEGSALQFNPYPGQGVDGITGESCVSPGTYYTGTPSGYSGYTSSGSAADPSFGYGSNIPLTMLNPADYDEEYLGSPLSPQHDGGEVYLSTFPGRRSGVFQKINANALWVPKSGGQKALGLTQFDIAASFAIPMLKPESPLIITPSFSAWFFDPKQGKSQKFYTTGATFRWIKPIVRNKLTLDLGVSAFYSGDFHISGKKAMRYPVHATAIWECNPRLKFILGVAYLDREDDYNWMPMAGLIWTPHDDLSVELVAPRIRVAQRIRWFGSAAGDVPSDWLYAAFEFGGGSWGFEYEGVKGHLDYRDFRALIGYERRTAFGLTFGVEVGYMFERKVEFDRLGLKTNPADSVFLRLRTSF